MHGLEFAAFALLILFYIVRALYRGLRRLVLGVRRALGVAPAPALPAAQPQQQMRPVQQMRPAQSMPPPTPPQQARPLARRPDPAPQPPSAPDSPTSDKITLRRDGKDLVRALIWQEILGPPRSQRPHRTPPQ